MSFIDSAHNIKNAKHPEDIFSKAADVDIVYKQYATVVHPDKNSNSAESVELFKLLNGLYSTVKEKIKHGKYGIKTLGTISKKDGTTYTLTDLINEDALANIYKAELGTKSFVCKVYRNPATKDFALAEANNLKAIYESPVKDLAVIQHVTKLHDSFQLNTKQYVNVFTQYGTGYTVEQVRNKYKNGLELKHAAWMFNRMLGSLLAVHQAGFVNNGLTPDSFLIYPKNHNGLLTNFSYSGKLGSKLTGYNPKWKAFYAPELLEKHPTSFGADIYMAAKCFLYLCGDLKTNKVNAPNSVQNFINYCLLGMKTRPQDAFEVHNDFHAILKNIFGEPKFVEFSME